jgi:hypothetical protein
MFGMVVVVGRSSGRLFAAMNTLLYADSAIA